MSDWYKSRWMGQRTVIASARKALREERRLRQIDKETIETLRSENLRLGVMASVGSSVVDAVESIKVAMAFPPPQEAK